MVIIMNFLLNNFKLLNVSIRTEITIAMVVGILLILAIICLTIIKKLKDK